MCKGIHYLIISNDKRGGQTIQISVDRAITKKKKKAFLCYEMLCNGWYERSVRLYIIIPPRYVAKQK